MPDLLINFSLSASGYHPVRSEVYVFVFADDALDLQACALVECFVKLRIVRLVVAERRCSLK